MYTILTRQEHIHMNTRNRELKDSEYERGDTLNTNRKPKVNSGHLDITPTRNSKFNPSITRINAIIHLGPSNSFQPTGQNCSSIKCGGCLCCFPPWSLPQRNRFVFLPFVRQFSFFLFNSFIICWSSVPFNNFPRLY